MKNCLACDTYVGQRAISKHLGIPAVGTVWAIVPAELYTKYLKPRSKKYKVKRVDYRLWNRLYPKWRKKHIIILKFDKPHKCMNVNEFLEFGWKAKHYQEHCPVSELRAFPEEALEILD